MRILLLFLTLVFITSPLLGNAAAPIEEEDLVYIFHLIYDHGELRVNPAAPLAYDLSVEQYEPERIVSLVPYDAQILSFSGEELASVPFDPQKGNPGFVEGEIDLKLPYFNNAAWVIFNREGREILAVSMGEVAVCNEDGMCAADVETFQNCPQDCKAPVPEPETSSNGRLLGGLLLIFALVLLAGSSIGIVLWHRRRSGPQPPSQTPTQV